MGAIVRSERCRGLVWLGWVGGMDGQKEIRFKPDPPTIRCVYTTTNRPPPPTTNQAHTLRSLAAITTGSGFGFGSTRPMPPIIPTPFGGLGLLGGRGGVRAFSVGFGGLQYDTLVEMQEK